jgi:hypothetical protein
MANLAKSGVVDRPAPKVRLVKLRELPTLQTGARNSGPHPLQVSILLENLELDHSIAWDYFGEHRDLGKPRLGEGVVDELHLLQ